MLTAKYMRDNEEAIRKSLAQRHSDYQLDELLQLDANSRKQGAELQKLKEERNRGSEQIAEAKKTGSEPDRALIEKLAGVKSEIEVTEARMSMDALRLEQLVWNMPNILHESVPYGKDETGNVERKRWGDTSKTLEHGHGDILESMGLIDIARAAKVSGARFHYIKGDLVLMGQALMNFALEELSKKGFTPVMTPHMIKRSYYKGVTGMGDFESALYLATKPKEGAEEEEAGDEDLFLIATSEHPIAAMHADEVFSAKELPLKYAGISQCFRREAGSHGKDTKGIFRVHQFEKVEQFVFARQEDSWRIYEELAANEEELLQKLGLPYHRIDICTGDIGVVAAAKTDMEAWFPSQRKYREVTSCSNCTDWQSVRLNIRYDEKGERRYVHTLNATAIAMQRTLAAIAENYYNGDGTITVPEALVRYMGKDRIGR